MDDPISGRVFQLTEHRRRQVLVRILNESNWTIVPEVREPEICYAYRRKGTMCGCNVKRVHPAYMPALEILHPILTLCLSLKEELLYRLMC